MRKLLCFLFLFCLLCGCQFAKEPVNTNQNDVSIFFHPSVSTDGIYHTITNSQKTIDIEKSDGSKTTRNYSQVYFYDYENQQDIPLCSKPNCFHQDENCDAYELSFLKDEEMYSNPIVYKDKLYYEYIDLFSPSFSICQSNLDGSNRKVIYSENGTMLQNAFIYKDKLYIAVNLYKMDEQNSLMKQTKNFEFYSINLDTKEKVNLSTPNKELVNFLSATDDKIYLALFPKEDTSSNTMDILCLEKGKIQTIQENLENQSTILGYKDKLYKMDAQTGNLLSCKYGETNWTTVLHIDEPGDYHFESLNPYGIYSVQKNNNESSSIYCIDLNNNLLVKDKLVISSYNEGYILETDKQTYKFEH